MPNIAKEEQLARTLKVSVCWHAFELARLDLAVRRRSLSDAPPVPEPIA